MPIILYCKMETLYSAQTPYGEVQCLDCKKADDVADAMDKARTLAANFFMQAEKDWRLVPSELKDHILKVMVTDGNAPDYAGFEWQNRHYTVEWLAERECFACTDVDDASTLYIRIK